MPDNDLNVISFSVEKDSLNRIILWTEKIDDLEGNQLFKRVDEYSFYPTNEIDEIVLNRFVGHKLVSKTLIKHFLDFTQPFSTFKSFDH